MEAAKKWFYGPVATVATAPKPELTPEERVHRERVQLARSRDMMEKYLHENGQKGGKSFKRKKSSKRKNSMRRKKSLRVSGWTTKRRNKHSTKRRRKR
jgi:hypothetical protein